MSSSNEKSAMEESRLEVMECEKEIQSIKSALKSIGSGGSAESSTNSLKVSVHKITSNGDSAAPGTFKVHLSSPIEERTITQLFDALNPDAEGGIVSFQQLETSNALLTFEAFSKNDGSDDLLKVGTSAAHDLLPLCQDLDVNGEKVTSTVEIAIVSESSEESSDKPALESKESDEWEDAVDEEKNEDAEATKEESTAETETKLQLPLCTLSVQLEYTPSANDKRDSLYEKLNEVSKRKAAAIEKLRQSAAAINRVKMAEEESKGKGGNVVKAGFLNKPKPEAKAVPFWKRWYEKTIGPKSMLWVVGPVAKNYVIFIGCSMFFHYKGDLLALPPPV